MTTTSSTEFRKHVKKYLDVVEKGERVRVIRHGKVIAEMVPPSLRPSEPSWKRPVEPLYIPGASLSRAIIEERRESR